MDPAPDHWHVVGDGAIGMALAHRLHRQGRPVTLITHEDHGRTRELSYRSLRGPEVRWRCDVLARPDGRPLERVLVTTKAYSVEEVFATWGEALAGHASIYYLQNGLDFEARGLPGSVRVLHVVNGGFTAFVDGPGSVVQSAMNPIWIGTLDGGPPPEALAGDLATLGAAGFEVRWTDAIRLHRWEKAGINTVINTLTVLNDCLNGQLLERPPLAKDVRRLCTELGALFTAMGLPFTEGHLLESTQAIIEGTAHNVSSTLQDLRAGRPRHELGYITRPLLEEAARRSIPMPTCEAGYREVSRRFEAAVGPGTP
ncbi:MAG: 2-dehydropantoate 2-reductase [Planctomycetota bacterium]|nr:2-dehydropantoate 2-reductase [Planctomycetota bacterium]